MLFSRSARTSLASAALACSALLLLACADPGASFDDFVARDVKLRPKPGEGGSGGGGGGGSSACTLPAAQAADGDFLFSLSASLDPSKPVMFLGTFTTEAKDQGLTFKLTLQPLLAVDRKTPTGNPLPVGPFDIGADGSFVANLPQLTVPGDANPISTGLELEATTTLAGSLCATDFLCGAVSGKVTKPLELDLMGSTFAMTKITDPSAYPPVVINCAKTPAGPPPTP